VKFWDTRNMSKAVKVLVGHSHWVWSAKYNPNHDQLIVR
jgi:WD40 repeat protein